MASGPAGGGPRVPRRGSPVLEVSSRFLKPSRPVGKTRHQNNAKKVKKDMGRLSGGQRERGREAPESQVLRFICAIWVFSPSEAFGEDGKADAERQFWMRYCIAGWLKTLGAAPLGAQRPPQG